jgi:hypothetical protein
MNIRFGAIRICPDIGLKVRMVKIYSIIEKCYNNLWRASRYGPCIQRLYIFSCKAPFLAIVR